MNKVLCTCKPECYKYLRPRTRNDHMRKVLQQQQQQQQLPPPVPGDQGAGHAGEGHNHNHNHEALEDHLQGDDDAEHQQHNNHMDVDDGYYDDYPQPQHEQEDVNMEDAEGEPAYDDDTIFENVLFEPEPHPAPQDDDEEDSESDDSDDEEAAAAAEAEVVEEADAVDNQDAPQEHDAPPFVESPLLSSPAYPGCEQTLKKILLMVITFTSQNKLTLEALGDLLRLLFQLLPPDNLIPHTTYKLFQLLGLDVDRFERHVCPNDCHVFDDLDKSEYIAHAEDVCPVCGTRRFVQRGATLSPAKKFYVLPLVPQIEALKRRPDFDSSVGKMWTSLLFKDTCYDTFWGGSLAQPYLAQCDDLNHFQQLLVLCLGMDGVNAFKTTHSVWPIGVKIWNLHPEERTSKDFVLLTALVPGPKPPSNLGPYLKPLLEEIKATETEPAAIYNYTKKKEEKLTLTLATSIQDQMSQIKSTEHIGPCGHINCWRCCHPSVPNEATRHGNYQMGYEDETAFTAGRKTNEEARLKSTQVADGVIEPKAYGIKAPSTLSQVLPGFDIVYGHMIDFFHNLLINCPKVFWKGHVFKDPPQGVVPPIYIMSNNHRKIFKERIQSLVVPHDMYKRPKDPASQRMKAEDWNIFIITSSVWAAEGLVNDDVLQTWVHYRNAYVNYLGGNFTAEKRAAAREDLKEYGKGLETHIGVTACTISNHLVIVEADHQIPVTGPIPESNGSWVERLMNKLTEYIKRRRIAAVPEKAMVLGYVLDQYVYANKGEIPRPERVPTGIRDDQEAEPRLLGVGKKYTLTLEEREWVRKFAEHAGITNHLADIPQEVEMFTRAFFNTEIHSVLYKAVRSRRSYNVALEYDEPTGKKTFFAIVHKFFRVVILGTLHRVALVTSYYNRPATFFGTKVIDKNRAYKAGKIVSVDAIDRKVIFTNEAPTKVLEMPKHYSRR